MGVQESKNEIWYLVPYGHHGKVSWTQSHPDEGYLWQRPYKTLHFVELRLPNEEQTKESFRQELGE